MARANEMQKTLDEKIIARIEVIGTYHREAARERRYLEAERYLLECWDLIPHSKFEYDYSQIISHGAVLFYRDSGQFDKSKVWLNIMAQAYGDPESLEVIFTRATVHFDAGELEDAFRLFLPQYLKYGRRPFEGEDPRYLNFVMQRALGYDVKLSSTLYRQVSRLSKEGNKAIDSGDARGAESAWRKALALLPEPKISWEAYTWLEASIGDALFAQDKFAESRESFTNALNGPDGASNPFVHYRLGQCLLQLRESEAGEVSLLKAYMLSGEDIFFDDEDEGRRNLEILKKKGLID